MLLTGLTPSARGSNPNHSHRRPTERPDRRGSHSGDTNASAAGGGPGQIIVDDTMAARQTLPAIERLDELAGAGRLGVQLILAEIGADMTQFPTAAHLVQTAVATGLVRGQPAVLYGFPHSGGTQVRGGHPSRSPPGLSVVADLVVGELAISGSRSGCCGKLFCGGAYVAGSSAWRRCAARKSSTMRSQS